MKITLINVEEAGMEPQMAEECRILIGRYFLHYLNNAPSPGDDITILYDPEAPLTIRRKPSNEAFIIGFLVTEVRPGGEVLVSLD